MGWRGESEAGFPFFEFGSSSKRKSKIPPSVFLRLLLLSQLVSLTPNISLMLVVTQVADSGSPWSWIVATRAYPTPVEVT